MLVKQRLEKQESKSVKSEKSGQSTSTGVSIDTDVGHPEEVTKNDKVKQPQDSEDKQSGAYKEVNETIQSVDTDINVGER